MKFSATFKPMTLFSLRDSNSTNSGAKSLLLPSPYAIKMAFISQAISLGGVDFNNIENFRVIRDAKISYRIDGDICVNNCFVKIQKQRDKEPFKSTISFREYVYMNGYLELIFDVSKQTDVDFLKQYLYTINYLGKRSCFYQFIKYNDVPNIANVEPFNMNKFSIGGVIQEYDDFASKLSFKDVNSYNSSTKTMRDKEFLILPLQIASSSKSFTMYRNIKCK